MDQCGQCKGHSFFALTKLITRVVNSVASANGSKQVIADVKTIARKMQRKRGSDTLPNDESQESIPASQMSFDNCIEYMDKHIQFLSARAGYAPNEIDLKVTTLPTLLADRKTKNTAVITTLAQENSIFA